MDLSASHVFQTLEAYLERQSCPGTLQVLQRAVLSKGSLAVQADGHWPIVDFPLALHRALGGDPAVGLGVAGTCAMFYGFADVVDDAQDHDLTAVPWDAWGWEQAVNTGLALLFESLQYLYEVAPQAAPAIVEVFIRAGRTMTHGQHVDLIGQDVQQPGWQSYLSAVERKSGASFGAYAQAIALANGQSPETAMVYQDLGRSLGVLFQMLNDTYELWNDRLSSDFENRRLSLPIALGFEQLQGAARQQLVSVLSGPRTLETQHQLVDFLEASGVKGYATLRIEVYRRKIEGLVAQLGLSGVPYLGRLLEIPAFPQHHVAI
ncbi:MAG TPA: polyprenyl synthetase family protein [Stenomitos sp.]